MKKLLVGIILSVFAPLFVQASAQEIALSMSATPANPIVGEKVNWNIKATGGSGTYTYAWNADSTEFPQLYSWTPPYPYATAVSVTNTYWTPGSKSVTVTVYDSDGRFMSRQLSLNVAEGRISVLSPGPNDVWYVGRTYCIRWKTEGQVDPVQIGLFDFRYNSETPAGETIITYQTPNTGYYYYTVPPASPDGISAGNIGGKNYRITVTGFGNSVPGYSNKLFTIR